MVTKIVVSWRNKDFPDDHRGNLADAKTDLALGCLMKPFTAEDVHRSLAAAEDLLRGRETLRPKVPDNLTLYSSPEEVSEPAPIAFIPSKPSLRTRFEHWIAGQQH